MVYCSLAPAIWIKYYKYSLTTCEMLKLFRDIGHTKSERCSQTYTHTHSVWYDARERKEEKENAPLKRNDACDIVGISCVFFSKTRVKWKCCKAFEHKKKLLHFTHQKRENVRHGSFDMAIILLRRITMPHLMLSQNNKMKLWNNNKNKKKIWRKFVKKMEKKNSFAKITKRTWKQRANA